MTCTSKQAGWIVVLASAFLLDARSADACMPCNDRVPDSELLEDSDIVIDGWGIERDLGTCAPPPVPAARRGCIEIQTWDPDRCSTMPTGFLLRRDSKDEPLKPQQQTIPYDGRYSFCGLAAGRYALDDQTIVLPSERGVGVVLVQFGDGAVFRVRFAVEAVLKGTVPSEVWLTNGEGPCRQLSLELGTHFRVFGQRGPNGDIEIRSCATRLLKPGEVAPLRRTIAEASTLPSLASDPRVTATIANPADAPRPRSGGCAATSDPRSLGLFAALAALRRRRAMQRRGGR
ncbi:MAG: hypothetical protein H6Q90_4585 [Deltaproteobacteria bacterium]|nr:hypothetical protein [Deltaproteobacteria bacterium]